MIMRKLNSDERTIVEYLKKFEKYLRSDSLDELANYIHEHIDFEHTAYDLETAMSADIAKEYEFGKKYCKIYHLNDFLIDKSTLAKSANVTALIFNIIDLFFKIELSGGDTISIKFAFWAEAFEKYLWGDLE